MKKSEEIALHKEIRNSFTFDPMKMLFCKDYQTQDGIIVRQPRVGEIVDIGEEEFYRNLNAWVTNTTSYRVSLWNMPERVDWCKITDFELFCSLYQAVDPDIISIILPNINLLSFERGSHMLSEEESELVLYSRENDVFINYLSYLEISQYLRTLFNIFPKDEFGKGSATKEAMIWEDEEKARKASNEGYKSMLFPLVSACINHPGFKHTLKDLWDVGIFEFMDSVNRLQIYENTRALLAGSMSGFCDTSKIPKDNFNFMRDIYTKENTENKKSAKDGTTFDKVVKNYNQ